MWCSPASQIFEHPWNQASRRQRARTEQVGARTSAGRVAHDPGVKKGKKVRGSKTRGRRLHLAQTVPIQHTFNEREGGIHKKGVGGREGGRGDCAKGSLPVVGYASGPHEALGG